MRTPVFTATAAIVLASSAAAQSPNTGSRDPKVWLSVGVGYMALQDVADGTTQSVWAFGTTFPYRLSLERSLGRGISAGAAVLWVRAPLFAWGPCSCNAHNTVAMYGPVFRLLNGREWKQVVEITVGVMQYGNFVEDATGARIEPVKANRDFAFGIGYGIAYEVSPGWEVELVTTGINSFHERRGLANNDNTQSRHASVRLGLRLGY